jgi:hypothetical protein
MLVHHCSPRVAGVFPMRVSQTEWGPTRPLYTRSRRCWSEVFRADLDSGESAPTSRVTSTGKVSGARRWRRRPPGPRRSRPNEETNFRRCRGHVHPLVSVRLRSSRVIGGISPTVGEFDLRQFRSPKTRVDSSSNHPAIRSAATPDPLFFGTSPSVAGSPALRERCRPGSARFRRSGRERRPSSRNDHGVDPATSRRSRHGQNSSCRASLTRTGWGCCDAPRPKSWLH